MTQLAIAYSNFSNDLPGIILSGDEIGMEIFYNIAATHWLYVTPDIQVIEPAGKRATTAFLTGMRLQMRFLPAELTIMRSDISIDKGYRGRIIEA